MKEALGYMEFAFCLGTAVGPVCAAVLYHIGNYDLPFYFFGVLMFTTIPLIYNLDIPDSEAEGKEHAEPEFIKALTNIVIVFIIY
jgi:MFS family permease